MRFVCFLWRGTGFNRPVAKFGTEHVATLAAMLRRHGGHSLSCVHSGFDMPDGVTGIRMHDAVAGLPDYMPKVWAWSPECHEIIGERFAYIDLDVVLLEDPAPAIETDVPIRLWDSAKGEPYNTSLFTLEPGHGHRIWSAMEPGRVARARAQASRWTGDQSWVAHVLGPDLPTFGEDTGIVRYRPLLHRLAPPAGTRAIFLCGPYEPASESARSKWILKNWR